MCVKYLVEQGADVKRYYTGEYGSDFILLVATIEKKNLGLIDYLISQGVDVNVEYLGTSLISHAIHNRLAFEIIKRLLEEGSRPSTEDFFLRYA